MGILSRHKGVQGQGPQRSSLNLLGNGQAVQGAGVVADTMADCGHSPEPRGTRETVGGTFVKVFHADDNAHASVLKRTDGRAGKSQKRRGWRDLCGLSQDSGKSHEHLFGRLTARFLRRRFPHKPAENIAVILNNSVSQCHDLLVGRSKWTLRHALILLKHFGSAFLHAVIHPVTGVGGGTVRLLFRRRKEAGA